MIRKYFLNFDLDVQRIKSSGGDSNNWDYSCSKLYPSDYSILIKNALKILFFPLENSENYFSMTFGFRFFPKNPLILICIFAF